MMRTHRALAAALVTLAACGGTGQTTYSGTLEAPTAAVGSTLGGRVTAVLVNEGQAVRAGQVIVRFDATQPQAELTSALARLAQVRAALADLRAGAKPEDLAHARALADQQRAQYVLAQETRPYQQRILAAELRQAQANLRDARAAALDARRSAERIRSLAATGDVAVQQRDDANARAVHADAAVASARAAVRGARAQLGDTTAVRLPETAQSALAGYDAAAAQYRSLAAGARPEEIRQDEAAVRAAEGSVADAQRLVAEATVHAPVDGVVQSIDLHPGDLIAAGAAVATIDEGGMPFTRIYVEQADLGKVRVGAGVPVRSDALPGATFEGTVASVDAQAQFTPLNVQTSSDRAVLAFGVKVDVRDPKRRLHGGTTVEVLLP